MLVFSIGCQKNESTATTPPTQQSSQHVKDPNKILGLNVLNPGFFTHEFRSGDIFLAGSDGKIITRKINDPQWCATLTSDFNDKITALAANNTGTTLMAVGENGLIARSDDSGIHWKKILPPSTKTITTITFDSKHQHWVAAGEQGLLLHSDATGNNWQLSAFNKAATISKILSLPTQLIVIGENGLIASSNDGGREWKIIPPLSSAALTDIVTTDAQIFITASNGNLIRANLSENNEIYNWELISTRFNHYLSRIFFHPQQKLLITLSSEGEILLSDDGGNLWAPVSQSNKYLNDIEQSNDDNYLIAVGDQGQVLISDNAGRTWAEKKSPTTTNIEGVIADGENGFIAYGEYGLLMQLTSINDEWEIINHPVSDFIHQLITESSENWIAVGAKGSIFNSKNQGQSWLPLVTGAQDVDYFLSAVIDEKSGNFITAGPPGTILLKKKNTDEWKVRLALSDSNKGYFHRLATNNKGTIIAIAGPGITHYSVDAGENWNPANIDNSKQLFNVIYDQYHQQFIAVGQEGIIQLSSDGKNWNLTSTEIQSALQTVFAIKHSLWAAGDKGVLIQSTDGGKTWQDAHIDAQELNSQPTILSMFETKDGSLIASGAQGFIARLNNADVSWKRITSPTQSSLRTPLQDAATGILYIPSKTGDVIYSKDDGLSWKLLPPFTKGSLKNLYIDHSNNMLIGVGERLIRTPLLTRSD